MPTTVLRAPPRIFRPCDGPGLEVGTEILPIFVQSWPFPPPLNLYTLYLLSPFRLR